MYMTSADYGVNAIMLMIPVGIGIFYAWKDAKHVNREEYLLGGRTMKMLPVSLSMLVTFQSALSLIGFPAEIFRFGVMFAFLYIGLCIGNLVCCYTLVPLVHPLKLTSIFDYLELRYKSRAVRMFCTVVGMVQMFFYMVMALVAPGLAIQAAANIPFWMSVAVAGGVGTLYTAIGGFKSVIWTDVFQACIMVIGLLFLIVKGTVMVGGPQRVWTVAEEGGRISMNSFSPDPRSRHTWWGMAIGGTFFWLTNMFSQSNFQRISSVRTVAIARKALLYNIPGMIFYASLIATVGVVGYSYFYVIRCDPLEAGLISNMNQVSIYFMLHVFQDWPGLAGLYMATIFSGALSTLSSGINALAANTVEDILSGCLRGVSERAATILTKILVLAYGAGIVGVAYLFKALPGPISQLSISITGSFGSVLVGVFLMGGMVPWANKYGVLVAGILTTALNSWMVIGSLLHGRKLRPLPPVPTDHCPGLALNDSSYSSSSSSSSSSYSAAWSSEWNVTLSSTRHYVSSRASPESDDPSYEYGFFLYDISYEWYACIGVVVCSATILIASKLLSRYDKTQNADPRFILPSLHKYWQLEVVSVKDEKEMEPLHKNVI